MAVRQFDTKTKPNRAPPGCDPKQLPSYTKAIAVVGAIVGIVTLFWMPLANPEFGDLSDRWASYVLMQSCPMRSL